MQKSYKKISWIEMLKRFEELGYCYTADSYITPKGYKQKQLIFRFDFCGGNGTKRLSPDELKEHFNGDITLLFGYSQYAPEQGRIYATNKIFKQGI